MTTRDQKTARDAQKTARDVLSAQVQTALAASGALQGRHIRVANSAGRVILEGEVTSFYQIQMAQETAHRVHGVQTIDNRLTIVTPDAAFQPVS